MRIDSVRDLTDRLLIEQRATDFARYISSKFIASQMAPALMGAPSSKSGSRVLDAFLRRWPDSPNLAAMRDLTLKTAVEPGTGAPNNWAAPLAVNPLAAAFVAFARPLTLLGRLPLRRVPIGTPVLSPSTGSTGFGWAGAGLPKPVSSSAWSRTTLTPATAAVLSVVTKELLLTAAPESDVALRDDLAAGLAAGLDEYLMNPANAGVTGITPASITNGVTPANSSTGDALEDLRTLARAYVAAGGQLASAAILISDNNAVALALRSSAGGGPDFSGLTVSGGVLGGLPAYASAAVGDQLVMIDLARLAYAEDSAVPDVAFSTQGAIEMRDDPSETPTTLVSLYQANLVAVRVERHVNWEYTGGPAIAIIDGVNYLQEGGSPA